MINKKAVHQNNRKGLTLIELVVTMAILGVVLTAIYSIFQFGLRSFTVSRVNADSQFEVRMPTEHIANHIRFADHVEIITSIPGSGPTATNEFFVYLDNGQLLYKDKNGIVNIPGTEGRTDFSFVVTKKANTNNTIAIAMGKTGTTTHDLVTDVIALNLNQDIVGTSGIGLKFKTDDAESITPVSINGLTSPPFTSIPVHEEIAMPTRVKATMSNDTYRMVAVRWSPSSIDTSEAGLKTSTGRVIGYSGTATFTVYVGDLAIQSVKPLAPVTIYQGQSFTMPETVVAIMTDGTNTYDQDVFVTWDTIITSESASEPEVPFEAIGTIDGFTPDPESPIKLSVTVLPMTVVPPIADLSVTVNQGTSYLLPSQVPATMSNGSIQWLDTIWSPAVIDTMSSGTKTSDGTAEFNGSYFSVGITVTVVKSKLPTPTVIIKTSGNNGEVWVTGGIPNATAIVRKSGGGTVGTGTMDSTGIAKITGIKTSNLMDAYLTMTGWFDSDPYPIN